MKKEVKYEQRGNSVFCGKIEIARAYWRFSDDECGVKILQGMPRMETADKIIKDCPNFAKEHNLIGKVPGIFAPIKKEWRCIENDFKFV